MYEYKPSRPFITEALRLRFEAGLSYRQIGEQLDVGMSAVHKLVQRFLRANLMWPLDESWCRYLNNVIQKVYRGLSGIARYLMGGNPMIPGLLTKK